MSPEPAARSARRRSRVLLASAVLLGTGLPARAELTPVFRWNAKLNGGYTGNVFYSQGRKKISSYGGTVKLFGSLVWKGPTSTYGGNYRTSYQNYSNRQATDLSSLSHNLTLTMNQDWNPRTQFLGSAKASYTPEQDPFGEQDDPADFNLTVHPRAQRTNVGVSAGWIIQTGSVNELRANINWGTTLYGDPVQPPPPKGQPQKPAQPFVDQNSYKLSGSFQHEVGPQRRVDVTGSWAHQVFDQTILQFAKVDKDGDGTFDAYKQTGSQDFSGSTDSITLTGGYSWEISELTRGAVGAGLLGSSSQDGASSYDWAVSATINQELSRWATTTFGLSRDQASLEGLGTSSVGTRAFANFQFDMTLKTKLKTTTSYSRSESQDASNTRVDYLKATIVFIHSLGKWGGYNISYAYNDQQTTTDQVVCAGRPQGQCGGASRYDLISFGLNFDPSKFLGDQGGKKK
jgi:hypothetical protein